MNGIDIPKRTGISLDTMDGLLDLAEVTWQTVAPCGCVAGVCMAAIGDERVVTAEQAGHQFNETEAQYQRDVKLGFTWRPRERHAAIEDMRIECTHEPKWGYQKPLTPEGYVWAAVRALGSRTKYMHLVSVEAVARAKERRYTEGNSSPLCGGRAEFHWSDEWHAKHDKVECSKCEAKAAKLVTA